MADVHPLGAHAGALARPLRARTAALFAELQAGWLGAHASTVPTLVRRLADRLAHADG